MPRYRKRFYGITLVLSLLVLTLQGVVTHAQTMFQGYHANVQIFNLSSGSTQLTLTRYNPDGTMNSSFLDTLPGNQSKTYLPINPTDNNFVGSLVATSSGASIVSNVNLVAPGIIAGASFIGQNTGATTVRLPLLFKNNGGYFTWFGVQNAGTSTANVQVQYSDGTSGSTTIAPGAAKNFFRRQQSFQ